MYLFGTRDFHQLYSDGFCYFEDSRVSIKLSVNDSGDPGVCQKLEAIPAGTGCYVSHCIGDSHSMSGGLDHRVGFSVNGGDTMAVLQEASDVVTVLYSSYGAVVPCG